METGSDRAEGPAGGETRLAHLGAALLLVALVLALGTARRLRSRSVALEPAEETWIDPASLRVEGAPSWTDPRWLERLGTVLGGQEPFAAADPRALERLRAALAGLAFVERVERCESSARGGLVLELALRRPVACIPVQDEYALVDEHGVVLEGRWPVPPRLGRASLPVIGRRGDALLDRACPGNWLAEAEHGDALAVALSLAEHVPEEQRATLGRIVIDARAARRASVSEPGVRLELEGGRVALFGRGPDCGEPGELSPRAKWRALTRALELFERSPVGGDWELVDLRWDRPELLLAGAPQLAASEPAPRNERGGRSTFDPTRPRVR